jgi:hypothetical protein
MPLCIHHAMRSDARMQAHLVRDAHGRGADFGGPLALSLPKVSRPFRLLVLLTLPMGCPLRASEGPGEPSEERAVSATRSGTTALDPPRDPSLQCHLLMPVLIPHGFLMRTPVLLIPHGFLMRTSPRMCIFLPHHHVPPTWLATWSERALAQLMACSSLAGVADTLFHYGARHLIPQFKSSILPCAHSTHTRTNE